PESIPQNWIDSVKTNCKWHYAHTSHGSQLTIGLNDYEAQNPFFNVAIGSCYLPNIAGALCIHDGQVSQTYITPDLYWQTANGMNLTRAVLAGNPAINYSAWSWCTQVNSYNESQIQEYLDSISLLEAEFPDVTFIYMTGNAQTSGSGGYNRYLRNNQIRQFCYVNDKVLFDFADLDCWWFNDTTGLWEQSTYPYNSQNIPIEHPAFNGNYGGHTTYLSCQQKAYATWYMFAVLSGWNPPTAVEEQTPTADLTGESRAFPNPFVNTTDIYFTANIDAVVTVEIFNLAGRLVKTVFDGRLGKGRHSFSWDGRSAESETSSNGIYFYRIKLDGRTFASGGIILCR
ncbi:T9SS type A sorting domain-containing protein, partial [candidate division WOR-3 bacterium]|nr:T9SS type A sorting domain-containing protein [candidate division WOR-3 bacterium]